MVAENATGQSSKPQTFTDCLPYHNACGGYHEYIAGISCEHRGMFSTLEECNDACGGYHDACEGGVKMSTSGFSISIEESISSPT